MLHEKNNQFRFQLQQIQKCFTSTVNFLAQTIEDLLLYQGHSKVKLAFKNYFFLNLHLSETETHREKALLSGVCSHYNSFSISPPVGTWGTYLHTLGVLFKLLGSEFKLCRQPCRIRLP